MDAIENVLNGDERCILETMRFIEILLILIFEGRHVLPKVNTSAANLVTLSSGNAQKVGGKRLDQAADRLHRQLIELIRNKDTESLIESLETNTIDINFMDDVGQTLLNWAAAFGTAEMVEYLCTKGADVNRGQRSSSLHYASCFGRPEVVKILLRYGANPDLRDEEGKIALDKACERGEEGHREVVHILQSPNDYIGASNNNNNSSLNNKNIETVNSQVQQKAENDKKTQNQVENAKEVHKEQDGTESKKTETVIIMQEKVDPEITENYIKRLTPILCKLYFNNMIQSVSKACLNLLLKLIQYASKEQLNEIICKQVEVTTQKPIESSNLSLVLVELISKVVEDKHNYDATLIALKIAYNLLNKCSSFILEEFIRLGVSNRIAEIASEATKMNDSLASVNNETKSEIVSNKVIAVDNESNKTLSATAILVALQQQLANSEARLVENKQKLLKKEIFDLAGKIFTDYILEAQYKPRDLALKLNNLVNQLNTSIELHQQNQLSSKWKELYSNALNDLKNVLNEDKRGISSYELSISGLVQALLNALGTTDSDNLTMERRNLFVKLFDVENISSETPTVLIFLVKKLISLLETIDKLPLYLYDPPGSYNLQSFTKKFKLILNKGENENKFLNFDGRVLRVEPLANVSHLEKYISKMVSKRWFDYERNDIYCLKQLKEQIDKNNNGFKFTYESDFDKNGLLYWIGTNGFNAEEWTNPSTCSLIEINTIDGKNIATGKLEDIVNHDTVANCHTSDDNFAWIVLDLGVFIIPSHYTLRHSKGFNQSAPRNWSFMMSREGNEWDLLYEHKNDQKLNEPGSVASWEINQSELVTNENKGWRYVRLQQNGKNSSEEHYHFSISGFEIYFAKFLQFNFPD